MVSRTFRLVPAGIVEDFKIEENRGKTLVSHRAPHGDVAGAGRHPNVLLDGVRFMLDNSQPKQSHSDLIQASFVCMKT